MKYHVLIYKFFLLLSSLIPELKVLVNIEEETRHNEFPQIKKNWLLYCKKDRTA